MQCMKICLCEKAACEKETAAKVSFQMRQKGEPNHLESSSRRSFHSKAHISPKPRSSRRQLQQIATSNPRAHFRFTFATHHSKAAVVRDWGRHIPCSSCSRCCPPGHGALLFVSLSCVSFKPNPIPPPLLLKSAEDASTLHRPPV